MAISSDTEHGLWVREAVAHFERPLAIYATRLVGDAETARDVVCRTRSCAFAARTVPRSGIIWPSGSSRSAATGPWMSCVRSIA